MPYLFAIARLLELTLSPFEGVAEGVSVTRKSMWMIHWQSEGLAFNHLFLERILSTLLLKF